MSKFVVTGAFGFIGNHLVHRLSELGHEVVAIDKGIHENAIMQKSKIKDLPGISILEIDLCDRGALEVLPDVDGVFHLAALNGTQNFYEKPWQTVINSTIPTLNLLDYFGSKGIGFFFYAGSSEAYAGTITLFNGEVPTRESVPLTISDPKELRWSYGTSKLHGEVACFAAQAELGVPVVVGRFHNVFGPGMGIHHVIPDFIERGKNGIYELYGANQTRSFIFVDDAVNCMLALCEKAIGEIVNIGSPNEVLISNLAEKIMEIAGWEGEIKEFSAPGGSVSRRAPNVEKLSEYIDVKNFVSLEKGLQLTLEREGLI